MREIRFRAWCKKGKGFIQGFNMVNFHSYYTKGLEPEIYRYSVRWKLSDIILMQYTGLEDNSGIGIYEGDITNNGVIVWVQEDEESEFVGWHLQDTHKSKYDCYEIHSFYAFTTPFEVIGNIYENPELLEVK